MDMEKSVLSIDSDVDDDDSEWNVINEDGLTTWTGIGIQGRRIQGLFIRERNNQVARISPDWLHWKDEYVNNA